MTDYVGQFVRELATKLTPRLEHYAIEFVVLDGVQNDTAQFDDSRLFFEETDKVLPAPSVEQQAWDNCEHIISSASRDPIKEPTFNS